MPQPPPAARARRTRRRPARPPDDRPLGHVWRRRALGWALVVSRRLAGALALSLGLLGGPVAPALAQSAQSAQSAQPAQLAADAAQLEAAVAASLAPPSSRGGPRVSLDPNGGTTVTFAIRATDDDDPAAIRAGALADTLAVLQTVYAAPAASHVRTLMVLGTFPFQGTRGHSVRESPVLRAVLSAERAAHLEWSQLSPDSLADVLDAWWLQSAFASVEAQPPPEPPPSPPAAAPAAAEQAAVPAAAEAPPPVAEAPPAEAAPATATDAVAPAEADALPRRLAVARAHLDESRVALDRGQVGIGRSQFKQFFDVWDELDESIAERYPGPYAAVDADLERAELALLHRQPEDLPGAHVALQSLAADLATIADQLALP